MVLWFWIPVVVLLKNVSVLVHFTLMHVLRKLPQCETLKRISCDQKLSFEYLLLGKKVYLHVIVIENDDVSIHEKEADDVAGFYCCYATKV